MALPGTIAVATKNVHKIREILEICRDWPVEWVVASSPGWEARFRIGDWPDVEETGSTYLENALLKARVAARALGVVAVADDSGIEVDALGGQPGPRSARFAGERATDEDNLRLLIDRIAEVSDGRTARYVCVAVCSWPDGGEVWSRGVCEGTLILEPRGTGGFGYDPAFVPEDASRTMAELAPEEKHRISHRGEAFRALRWAIEREPRSG